MLEGEIIMLLIEKIKVLINRKNVMLEEIAEEWLEAKKIQIKESTYNNYLFHIRKYINPKLGRMKISSLKKYDFNLFVNQLIKELSPKTVKDILGILKSILIYTENEYKCSLNIYKIKIPKVIVKNLVVLSQKEKRKLEKCCLKENDLKCLGIIICLNTGLRIGEICALKWKDIDIEKRIIYVRKTLERIYNKNEKKTQIILDNPKTLSSIRQIPISSKIYEILKDKKNIYNKECFFLTGEMDSYIEPHRMQIFLKVSWKKVS